MLKNAGRYLFFFFSSRRRHTRLQGDWSSDVCSSDLPGVDCEDSLRAGELVQHGADVLGVDRPSGADVLDVRPQLPLGVLLSLAHGVQEGAVGLPLDEREE